MTSTRQRSPWPVPVLLLTLASLASVATSRRMPAPTHAPVYMSWKAFRQSARVVPPRAIKERGKIYSWGKFLFLSEPNQGVHVFDNTHPQAPVALAFIEAPGNIDIAGRGRYLYIDSFVDLLVFELTPKPFALRLMRRMKDVFPYNYRQSLPRRIPGGPSIWPARSYKTKGVVVGWKSLVRRKP